MIDTVQKYIVSLEKKVGTDAKSPLFAQLAAYYLETSRTEEALRICDAGLANFPFYTTGHLMKGKALVALNMKAEARREFEFVLDFLPHNEAIKKLLAQTPFTAEETLTAPPPTRKIISSEPVQNIPSPELPPAPLEGRSVPSVPAHEAPPAPEPSFNFGGFEQATSVQQPEPPPSAVPPQNFFEELIQAPSSTPADGTSGFGMNTPAVEEHDTFNTSPFSEFNFPQPEPIINTGAQPSSMNFFGGAEFTPPTGDMNLPFASVPREVESYEHYMSRRAKELTGENTVSLDEYLSTNPSPAAEEFSMPGTGIPSTGPEEFTLPNTGLPSSSSQDFSLPGTGFPSPGSQEVTLPESIPPTIGSQDIVPTFIDLPSTDVQNKIEELTNKLQNAGKITPVINFAQKDTQAASDQDTPSGMGFVTPTLAEIYAKQGWFDDAIKAYKTLAHNKPAEKEKFEKRIAELEEMKKKSGS
jgi:hypothetical protein